MLNSNISKFQFNWVYSISQSTSPWRVLTRGVGQGTEAEGAPGTTSSLRDGGSLRGTMVVVGSKEEVGDRETRDPGRSKLWGSVGRGEHAAPGSQGKVPLSPHHPQVGNLSRTIEKINGVARCPYDPRHNSTAVISSQGELYAATVIDFSGRDPAIYRSLGSRPPLRTAQYNSKWLNGKGAQAQGWGHLLPASLP